LSIGSIGTVSQGNNLLGTDPLFQIPGYWDTNGTPADQSDDFWVDGDYHLTSISPARDTGVNNAPGLPTTDFDGNLRILNSIVDRGAYEFEPAFVDIEISDSAGDLDDLSIDFGSVVVGDTSSIETVTVTNDGTLPLLIGSVVAPSAPFIMSDSCSNGSLGPGNDCTVDLQFIPATEGSFSGTLSIPSNDPDTPLAVVSVSGIGTAVPVPVISVGIPGNDFNDVAVGDTSTPKVATISNTGSGDLTVSGIALATGHDFHVDPGDGSAGTCGSTPLIITPGGSCTVSVTFSPIFAGTLTDTLMISSDDPDDPVRLVHLSGYGLSSIIQVTPRTIDFGTLTAPSGHQRERITVSNVGSTDLDIPSFSLVGGAGFSFQTPICDTFDAFNAGDECEVDIFFRGDIGVYSDIFTITFDDLGGFQVKAALTAAVVSKPRESSGCGSAMSEPEEGIVIGLREFLLLFALVMLWRRGMRRVHKRI
jgi:hypothetical protein